MPTLIMIQNKLTINARAWTYVVQDIFNFAVRSAADKADSLSTKPKFWTKSEVRAYSPIMVIADREAIFI